ncbi:hypothetical protein MKK75_25070 [Methylobacterium sp. J-030]|uniref:hypothetical protein n=1 Tax=Methylobacterium sp. J-030 TaxID=2836627 RepID=UPI001FBB2E16|nr:hypothetical protein [Methylobacterium sp. J-030]MCJ2072034.1 hypothetical protein [Methylobacterium sp. J-030]
MTGDGARSRPVAPSDGPERAPSRWRSRLQRFEDWVDDLHLLGFAVRGAWWLLKALWDVAGALARLIPRG